MLYPLRHKREKKNTEHSPDGCLIWINVQKHFILNKQLHDGLMKRSGQVQLCRKETFVKFTIQASKSTWPLTKKPGGKIDMLQRFYSLPSTGFTTVNFIQHNSRGKVNILEGDSNSICDIRSSYGHVPISEWLPSCLIFIVVPCMLFQSLLYCSNSCPSLHFKTLNLTLKHSKFTPTCFGLLWKHPQGIHGHTSLHYWIGMLIYIHKTVDRRLQPTLRTGLHSTRPPAHSMT